MNDILAAARDEHAHTAAPACASQGRYTSGGSTGVGRPDVSAPPAVGTVDSGRPGSVAGSAPERSSTELCEWPEEPAPPGESEPVLSRSGESEPGDSWRLRLDGAPCMGTSGVCRGLGWGARRETMGNSDGAREGDGAEGEDMSASTRLRWQAFRPQRRTPEAGAPDGSRRRECPFGHDQQDAARPLLTPGLWQRLP